MRAMMSESKSRHSGESLWAVLGADVDAWIFERAGLAAVSEARAILAVSEGKQVFYSRAQTYTWTDAAAQSALAASLAAFVAD